MFPLLYYVYYYKIQNLCVYNYVSYRLQKYRMLFGTKLLYVTGKVLDYIAF